jgi:hypothetical protein
LESPPLESIDTDEKPKKNKSSEVAAIQILQKVEPFFHAVMFLS